MSDERRDVWRYRLKCDVPGCLGSGDKHYRGADEAMFAFRQHMAAHALPRLIVVDRLFLTEEEAAR